MTQSHRLDNPFPGLRAFTAEEDHLFFGREEQTMELLQTLGTHRFVSVVGTSGSGKSSLVRCGLLSQLLGGKMLQAGTVWEVAVTQPGAAPMSHLADALLQADLYDLDEEDAKARLMATLSRSHFGLVEAIRQAQLPSGTNFLLVVDQFEEIFRFNRGGSAQRDLANEFVSMLLQAASQTDLPIYIVLTMRSDFIGDCAEFENLAEAVNRGEYLIPRMTREQFKQAIEGPIRVAGARIAPRLLQRLLNDLGNQADQLPCLQHALMRTWDQWRRGTEQTASGEEEPTKLDLDLPDYDAVGRMSEALSRHADEIYGSLDSDRTRELCAAMFKALTVRESENRGIRRPQTLGRLVEILGAPMDALKPIVEAYREPGVTFLMPPTPAPLEENTTIDISHESLMRVWVRLRDWVEEEAQSVGIFHRLAESAALHEAGRAGLYRDPELGIALSWLEEAAPNGAWAHQVGGGFERALAYLEQSRAEADREEKQREEARQRELEQARVLAENQRLRAEERARSARRMKVLTGVAVLVAIGAGIAALFAMDAYRSAEAQKQIAREAEANVKTELYVADMNRAGQAYAEGSMSLLDDLLTRHTPRGPEWHFWRHASQRELASFPMPAGPASQITVSPDQKIVAMDFWPGNIALFDADRRDLVKILPVYENNVGRYLKSRLTLAFSPDGKTLAAAGPHPFLRRWDTQTWKPRTPELTFPTEGIGEATKDSMIRNLAYSADGAMLAAWYGDATEHGPFVAVWDCRSWRVLQLFDLSSTNSRVSINDLVFSPNDNHLYASLFEGTNLTEAKTSLVVLDVARGGIVQVAEHASPLVGLDWSPDGRWLVTGHWNGEVNLFSSDDLSHPQQLTKSRGWIVKACFSPKGRYLAASSPDDNSIMVWEMPSQRLVSTLKGHSRYALMDFVGDEGKLWSTGQDLSVKVWDVQKGGLFTTLDGLFTETTLRYLSGGRLAGLGWFTPSPIRLYDVDEGRELPTWEEGELFEALRTSANGEFLAAEDQNQRTRLWNSETRQLLGTLSPPPSETNTTSQLWAVSNDGERVALGERHPNAPHRLLLWNVGTNQRVPLPNSSFARVTVSVFSSDNTLLAATGMFEDTFHLTVWDITTEPPEILFSRLSDNYYTMDFSPDGTRLALGSWDSKIDFVDSRTGNEVGSSLSGHAASVLSLAFSPDGNTLFSTAMDQTIRLWDTRSGAHLTTLPRLENAGVSTLILDPKGRWLLSNMGIEPAHLWRLDSARDSARSEMLWAEAGAPAGARGDLEKAGEVARRAVEVAPHQAGYDPWAALAGLAVYENNPAAFHKTTRDMMESYRRQPSLYLASWLCSICSLTPAPSDLVESIHPIALEMARSEAAGSHRDAGKLAVIFIDYRLGRYQEALARAKAELGEGPLRNRTLWSIPTELVLAMSHQQLGQEAEARAALTSARKTFAREGSTFPATPEHPDPNWLITLGHQILLNEAEGLIDGK